MTESVWEWDREREKAGAASLFVWRVIPGGQVLPIGVSESNGEAYQVL
jgi:hypothetical protein